MRTRFVRIPGSMESLHVAQSNVATNLLAPAALDERRSDRRYVCDFLARVVSGDRDVSTLGRIVNISKTGAKVEVMFPRRGPSVAILIDLANDDFYECVVRWRTDDFIGVRFLDLLGPARRRRYFTGEPIPLKLSAHRIIQLENPPREDIAPGPPPRRFGSSQPVEKSILSKSLNYKRSG